MLRRIRKNYRRLVAFMLTVAMTFTNVGTNLNVAFAAGEEQEALFLVDGSDLREAIQDAMDGGETFKFSSLELKAKSKSLKTSYEKLIGGKNGAVYQLDVDVDESYAPENTSVEVFYNAGTEDVIFLFINESNMVVKFRANVDGYETARVTINPNAANVEDTEASYVEDYSETNMVDDMPHTLGAEVLNPTTEADTDADEGTEADVTEPAEAPEETSEAVEGTEAEESTEAGDNVADSSEAGEAVETTEAGEDTEATDAAEATTAAEGNADAAEATTEAEEEADTAEAATEAEEVSEPEETDAPEAADESEADAADDDAAAEAADGAGEEAAPQEGAATASISIRKLQQVASSVQVLDDADIVIDPEEATEDDTPEINEDTDVEVDTEAETEAPEEEAEETTEAETEDTRAAETEETTAEAETTEGVSDETAATGTEDETPDTSAAEDETDATTADDETDADITIEETTAAGETSADETTAADTSVDMETPAETDAADSTIADKTETPEGNGGASAEIPDLDDGQLLEDDINGAIQNLGDLKGTSYNTVTIWGSANARAYKVDVKDLEGVAAIAGTYDVSYAVDPVGSANIRGAKSVQEGENLYFYVDPQVGYEITSVTANGVELETVDEAEVEASALAGHDYVYVVEAVEEDLEIVASLVEMEGMSHPEFSPAPVNRNGVTITVHAEEGIIPAGTELQVTEVTSQIRDAVVEKLESENEDTVNTVIAYDINLVLNGQKLDNSWSENGYVDVSFSGSRIRQLTEEADKVTFYAADDDNRVAMSARNAAQVTADNLELEVVGETDVEEAVVSTVSFEAEHFTIYVGAFTQQDTEVAEQISVNVSYLYDETFVAAQPSETEVIEKEEGKTSYEFTKTVNVPDGYTAQIYEEESDGYFVYDSQTGALTATIDGDAKESKVTLLFVPQVVPYTVVAHYPGADENIPGETENDTREGKVGTLTMVSAEDAPKKDGFEVVSVNNQVIEADGSTVVDVQYARREYTLVYNTNGGSYVRNQKGVFGKTVTVYKEEQNTETTLTCSGHSMHTYEGTYRRWGITYYYGGCYPDGSGSGNNGTGGAIRSGATCGGTHRHINSCYGTVTNTTYTPQPTKPGYTFTGWYTDANCTTGVGATVTFDGTVHDTGNESQLTVYAGWEAQEVNYTVVYYKQVWDNDTNSAHYVYDSSKTLRAVTGTRIDGTSQNIRGNYSIDHQEYDHADTNVEVMADGTTVVNVYYDLIPYTLVFNLNNSYATLTINGTTYKNSEYRITNAYLGRDISQMWPTADKVTVSNNSTSRIEYWRPSNSNTSYVTKRFEVTDEMVRDLGTNRTNTFTAKWNSSLTTYKVEYWLQSTDGNSYAEEPRYTQTYDYSSMNLGAKELDGFNKYAGTPSGYTGSGYTGSGANRVYTFRFYYTRKSYDIVYYSNSEELDTKSVKFGADINSETYNYIPDRPEYVDEEYNFGGWYDNINCLGEAYNFTTMPNNNVALYAKWVAPEKKVTFVFYNAETNQEIIVVKDATVDANDIRPPQREGFEFDGWYTDEALTEEFDINAPITKDITVYAKWVETRYADYTVRYVVRDSSAEGGYRDISEPKIISDVLVGSTVLEQAISYAPDGIRYVVDHAFQSYKITSVSADNVILFVYTSPADIEYMVEYVYTDMAGEKHVVETEESRKAEAASFNVYRNQAIVERLNQKGYTVNELFVRAENLSAENTNVVTFTLSFTPFTIKYTGIAGITGWDDGRTGMANPNPATYTLNDGDITLVNPMKTGYTFTGWTLTSGNAELAEGENTDSRNIVISIAQDGSKSRGSLAFRADWQENTYTVNYDANNGTPASDTSLAPKTGVLWTAAALLPEADAVTRNGYTLTGWKLTARDEQPVDGKVVTDTDSYSALAETDSVVSVTLTAQWEINQDSKATITYQTEAVSKGTVGNEEHTGNDQPQVQDTIQIVNGATLRGATAAPATGYKFDGWYKGEGESEVKVSEEQILTPEILNQENEANENNGWLNRAQDGTYTATTFTAKFVPDPEQVTTVTYKLAAVNENKSQGYIGEDQAEIIETIQIITGEIVTGEAGTRVISEGVYPAGTTAVAKAGYKFEPGWNRETPSASISTTSGVLTPENVWNNLNKDENGTYYISTVFVAEFSEEDEVVLTYRAEKDDEASENGKPLGTVSMSSENIAPATGHPQGSTASPNPGYEFTGWTVEGSTDIIGNEETLVEADIEKAAKKSGAYVQMTFVAHFEQKDDVTITYTSEDTTKGTVNPGSETLAPATGNAGGSTATPAEGYKVDRWVRVDKEATDTEEAVETVVASKELNGADADLSHYTPAKVKENETDEYGLNVAAHYKVYFTEREDLSYEIHYLYESEDAPNGYVENVEARDTVVGTAKFGSSIIHTDKPSYQGHNYVFERVDGATTVTVNDNIQYVYYALDEIGEENPEDKDGIPDKYQILFEYLSLDEYQARITGTAPATRTGDVKGTTKEVHTLYDVKKAEDGTITAVIKNDPTARPNAAVTPVAVNDYAFDFWTMDDPDAESRDMDPQLGTFANEKYGKSHIFIAQFAEDKIGEEDPEEGDDIPDKYQITLTYKVVNGNWNGTGSKADIKKVYTLKDTDGQYSEIGSTNPVSRPAVGDAPDRGYKTGYVSTNWNPSPEEDPETEGDKLEIFHKTDDNREFTYTYQIDQFGLTVVHVFNKADGTEAGRFIEVNAENRDYGSPVNVKADAEKPFEGREEGRQFVFDKVNVIGMTDTDTVVNTVTGTMPNGAVVITFTYEADDLRAVPENPDPTDPYDPDGADGIPDKYQITFHYVSEDTQKGTVTGTTKEVHTRYELTPDTVNGGWSQGAAKDVYPDAAVTVNPNKNGTSAQAFDFWTRDYDEAKDFHKEMSGFKGESYKDHPASEVTFTAHFDVDVIGGPDPDPENPDPETPKSDDIPDKYQITVTHRVVNGGWNGAEDNSLTMKSIQKVLTLMKDGHWDNSDDATATYPASEVPAAGENPAAGYTADHWDKDGTLLDAENPIPPVVFTKADDLVVYTYTYKLNVFPLTVRHDYRDLTGNVARSEYESAAEGSQLLNQYSAIFGSTLDYRARTEGNYVFAGVAVDQYKAEGEAASLTVSNRGHVTGTMPAGPVTIVFTYEVDEKEAYDPDHTYTEEEPYNPNGSDQIPDRYQITFTYMTQDSHGHVEGITTEVRTVQEIAVDQATGVITLVGERHSVNPAQPSTVTADDGYRFANWKDSAQERQTYEAANAQTAEAKLAGANAALRNADYDQDMTFEAFFENDPGKTVLVTYRSDNDEWGTVTNTSGDSIQIVDAAGLSGSQATAKPGYKFAGWYVGTDVEDDSKLAASPDEGSSNPLSPEAAIPKLEKDGNGNYAATTFTAKFVLDDEATAFVTYINGSGAAKGSVNGTPETIQVVTGYPVDQNRLEGATAAPQPGYHFVGWYKGNVTEKQVYQNPEMGRVTDRVGLTSDMVHDNLEHDSTNSNLYANTTYTAIFAQNEDVTLTYVSSNINQGTVVPGSESVAPATGNPKGSVATPNKGYHFVRWTLKEQDAETLVQKVTRAFTDPLVSEFTDADGNGVLENTKDNDQVIDRFAKRSGLYVNTTFEAHFEEDPAVTINYVPNPADGSMGTVSRSSESLAPVTDSAQGSVAAAKANEGYKFVNWTDASDEEVSKDPAFIPKKVDGLNVAATYTANFAKRDDLSYEVHYWYDDVEDEGRQKIVERATFDADIEYHPEYTQYLGENYVFEGILGPVKVGIGSNVLNVYFAKDAIGTNPGEPDTPDGIPDKYQITFRYRSAGNGTVAGTLREVHTVYEDVHQDPVTGRFVAGARKPATPNAAVTVTPDKNFAFDFWTADTVEGQDQDEKLADFANRTYMDSTVFTANFAEDVIGGPDPENPGDDIPDKYQITVTHKVVNGGWNGTTDNSLAEKAVEKVLTLKTGDRNDENGTAAYGSPVPEAGANAAVGYKAGAWDKTAPATFRKADNNSIYTYTYVKDSFKLTVRHEYTAANETTPGQVVVAVDNADTEFGSSLSFQAASAGNYTFAGVTVEGLADTNIVPEIVEGTMPAGPVVITFRYDEDSKGTNNPNEGDGIPDKYQITFTYVQTENGTVSGKTSEVMTVQDITKDPVTGTITPVGPRKSVHPTQPSTVTANEGYYFLNWMDSIDTDLGKDDGLRSAAYSEDMTFRAFFKENPDNAWTAVKRVTNIPSRGYFRVGETAIFTITVTNTGNRTLNNMRIQETLNGAVLRVPENSGYTVNGDVVIIGTLEPGASVTIEASYTVTRNDLFNRNFRNIVRTMATVDNQEPGEDPDSNPERVVTADSGTVPAGAQGGGSGGGGGGGGGSSTRSPGAGGGAGGPGTVTIDPEAVPLANLPDMGNDDILALIDDEEVPLAALPKTGQTGSAALMLMLSSMMLAAFAVVTRKKEDEQ